jgi:hypothetical protein
MVSNERRRRRRVELRCPVYFVNVNGSRVVESTTENLTSGGFYCLLNETLTQGECLFCTIVLPDSRDSPNRLTVQCIVEVMRVTAVDSTCLFGVACRIRDYSVLSRPPEANICYK